LPAAIELNGEDFRREPVERRKASERELLEAWADRIEEEQ
jgi:hypothetical protein